MANLKETIQQIYSPPVNNTPAVNTKKNPLELMIMQNAMAQNADANTLAGVALGKLLRGLFDDWKERYDARGFLKVLANQEENERNENLARLAANNPQQYQLTQEYLARNGGAWDTWQNPPQFAPTSKTMAPITLQHGQQAVQKFLGDTDFLTEQANTPSKSTQAPWQDDANWDRYKWNSLDDALNSVRARWRNGLRF